MELCRFHLDRGYAVTAEREVDGDPMCKACFSGREISVEELVGESADSREREYQRRYCKSEKFREVRRLYYRKHRDRICAAARKHTAEKRETLEAMLRRVR